MAVMDYPVTYKRKVRYSDTDHQGVVFNGNYFTYFDDALADFFDALGLPESVMAERGHDVTVARAEADFKSAGMPGETMVVRAGVGRVGNTSITFDLSIWDEDSGRAVAEGREVYVILDRETGRPVSIPDYLIEALESLQGSAE